MNILQEICFKCEQELTEENTRDYGGIDDFNYRMAKRFSPSIAETFINCDDCYEAEIDTYLENQEF